MFITGGHNVYPAEVEQTLLSMFSDKVLMLQVLGVPHPKLQETAALALQLRPGAELTESEIKERCAKEMEWPKVPRYIMYLEDWSRAMTVTGKMQKFKLKEMFIEKFNIV